MKNKLRLITVNNKNFKWRVVKIDWNNVLLKVWIDGKKSIPWLMVNKHFNNWYDFIGIGEDNFAKLNLTPITPKLVSYIISFVIKHYNLPTENYKTFNFTLDNTGEITQRKE